MWVLKFSFQIRFIFHSVVFKLQLFGSLPSYENQNYMQLLEALSEAVKFVSWLSASGKCNKNEVKPSIKKILETNGHVPAAYWQTQGKLDFSQEAKCGIDNNHRAEKYLFHICLKLD